MYWAWWYKDSQRESFSLMLEPEHILRVRISDLTFWTWRSSFWILLSLNLRSSSSLFIVSSRSQTWPWSLSLSFTRAFLRRNVVCYCWVRVVANFMASLNVSSSTFYHKSQIDFAKKDIFVKASYILHLSINLKGSWVISFSFSIVS